MERLIQVYAEPGELPAPGPSNLFASAMAPFGQEAGSTPLLPHLPIMATSQETQRQPFVDLITTISSSWQQLNKLVQDPANNIVKLHLETLSLVRGLHGNAQSLTDAESSPLPFASPSASSSSSSFCPSTPSGSNARRASRKDAASRLLGLEPQLVDMRNHVTQLVACSQFLSHAALSVESELDFVGGCLDRLKRDRPAQALGEDGDDERGGGDDDDGERTAVDPSEEDEGEPSRRQRLQLSQPPQPISSCRAPRRASLLPAKSHLSSSSTGEGEDEVTTPGITEGWGKVGGDYFGEWEWTPKAVGLACKTDVKSGEEGEEGEGMLSLKNDAYKDSKSQQLGKLTSAPESEASIFSAKAEDQVFLPGKMSLVEGTSGRPAPLEMSNPLYVDLHKRVSKRGRNEEDSSCPSSNTGYDGDASSDYRRRRVRNCTRRNNRSLPRHRRHSEAAAGISVGARAGGGMDVGSAIQMKRETPVALVPLIA